VLTPATLDDARGMLAPALADPDPVLIFEHGGLYPVAGDLSASARATRTVHLEKGQLYAEQPA
jgi:pyruvate/2-oxoglutarate/acetoin dehydrogenase E1 component